MTECKADKLTVRELCHLLSHVPEDMTVEVPTQMARWDDNEEVVEDMTEYRTVRGVKADTQRGVVRLQT